MQFPINDLFFKVEYINTDLLFKECINYLQNCDQIAFDLEFDRDRYKYGFNLCLVQVCCKAKCYVIDPLEISDLTLLFEIFENEKIQKVAHCSDQDLLLLHSLNCSPKNIYDTEIPAKLLNYEFTALAKLIELKFNYKLDKKLQTSNWNIRPLEKEQITYSSLDVIFLLELKKIFDSECIEKNIENWVKEENANLDRVVYEERNIEEMLSPEDKKSLSEYNQFIYNELLKFREKLGKATGKPSYKVVDKETLKLIALGKININNWTELKGIYGKVKTDKIKTELEELIKNAQNIALQKNLNRNLPKPLVFTEEEKVELEIQRIERENIKSLIFKPIQDRIKSQVGEFATRHIFGDGLIYNLIRKTTYISNVKFEYRKKLVLNIANELKIDLSGFMKP